MKWMCPQCQRPQPAAHRNTNDAQGRCRHCTYGDDVLADLVNETARLKMTPLVPINRAMRAVTFASRTHPED